MEVVTMTMARQVTRLTSFVLAIIAFSGAADADTRSVAIGQNADGRLQVFASGQFCTGSLFTCSQLGPSAGWGPWRNLPASGDVLQYVVGQNLNGRLEAFMLRQDGRCLHFWQEQAGGSFTGGDDIGAVGWKQIAIGRNADGRLELFGLVAGDIYHLWQLKANGGWSASEPFGTSGVTQFAVASNADGRMEVFAIVSGDIYHFWQTKASNGWSPSAPFGTTGVTQVVVASNADGRLEVFAVADSSVWHFWQTAASNGWSNSKILSKWSGAKQIAVGRNAAGRLEAFVLNQNGNCQHFWQESSGGDFAGGRDIGAVGWEQIAMGRNADGRLDLFALREGDIYHMSQTVNGGWSVSSVFPDPEPDFDPTILSFGQAVLDADNARLEWSVKTGPCCVVEIEGMGNTVDFDHLAPTGSVTLSRGCPPGGGDYQYELSVRCGKRHTERMIAVPNGCAPTPPAVKGPSKYQVWNCHGQKRTVDVFLVDSAAGTSGAKVGTINQQWANVGGIPSCGPLTSSFGLEVPVPDGHTCRMIIRESATGDVRQEHPWVIGDGKGPVVLVTVP